MGEIHLTRPFPALQICLHTPGIGLGLQEATLASLFSPVQLISSSSQVRLDSLTYMGLKPPSLWSEMRQVRENAGRQSWINWAGAEASSCFWLTEKEKGGEVEQQAVIAQECGNRKQWSSQSQSQVRTWRGWGSL